MKRIADKSKAYYLLTVWGFLVAACISGAVFLNSYIGNSELAKQKYEVLLAVDAAGGDVEKALYDLRVFVYSHMNTTIGSETGVRPPIQLKYTYERLVAAEKERVKKANDDLYNKGQVVCEQQFPNDFSGRARVPCVSEYVITNAVKEQTIPEGLYKYDFVSPLWSADAAGISLLVTLLCVFLFVVRLLIYKSMKHHFHMSS